MKKMLLLTLLSLTIASSNVFAQGSPDKETNVYVWDFVTRDLKKTDLTANFTHDFEEALSQYGQRQFRVLERRNLGQLIAQIDNERAAHDILDISDSSIKSLRSKQADLVIFGEVFDDVASGQVSITVTFQSFDGTKSLIKSVLMSRGLVNDATSRREAMENMIKDLTKRSASIWRTEVLGFIFDLKECRLGDRKATCDLLVTNNREDRNLRICGRPKHEYMAFRSGCQYNYTRAFDDSSTEAFSRRALLAGKNTDDYYNVVETTLIAGRPASLTLFFNDLSTNAATLSRLDLACWDSESNSFFTATLRNIPFAK